MMPGAMRLRLLQLDAFADRLFAGNPAAVCPLPAAGARAGWLEDATLQAIARENNLSETAFLLRRDPAAGAPADYAIRWFTPVAEVELCGHATLASAAVVLDVLEPGRRAVTFHSQSGPLPVERAPGGEAGAFRMDFPRWAPAPCDVPPALGEALSEALGAWPRGVLRSGATLIAVLDGEDDVAALAPDFGRLRALPYEAVIVTARAAPGDQGIDFVSRFFAPAQGIDEDPVTGSAHCSLAPYWGARLKKTRLRARQRSARGGTLLCELIGDRVFLEGGVVPYLDGTIELAD